MLANYHIDEGGQDMLNRDFLTKPYKTSEYIKEEVEEVLPMDFYDNDDGFWDDHLAAKNRVYAEHAETDMVTALPFF